MVAGYPPFSGPDSEAVLVNILQHEQTLMYPEVPEGEVGPSAECWSFIKALLNGDPEKRMGYNGLEEVQQHPWFQRVSFNWRDLQSCPPPFVPDIEGDFDYSYFDTSYLDAPEDLDAYIADPPVNEEDEEDTISDEAMQAAYKGFTYRKAPSWASSPAAPPMR